MNIPKVSFDEFELPFSQTGHPDEKQDQSESDDEDDGEGSEALEKMEALVPVEAVYLGLVDAEVDNWRSWKIEDRFYIIRLQDSEYEWALFRITWDDNWERFEWSFDMRASGFETSKDAAKYMVKKLFENWEISLKKRENAHYVEFLTDL